MMFVLIRSHEDRVTDSGQTIGTHEESVAIHKSGGENSEKNPIANTLIFSPVRKWILLFMPTHPILTACDGWCSLPSRLDLEPTRDTPLSMCVNTSPEKFKIRGNTDSTIPWVGAQSWIKKRKKPTECLPLPWCLTSWPVKMWAQNLIHLQQSRQPFSALCLLLPRRPAPSNCDLK